MQIKHKLQNRSPRLFGHPWPQVKIEIEIHLKLKMSYKLIKYTFIFDAIISW